MIKINIIGSIFGSSGYDSHTRSLANALYKVADCKLTTQLPVDWIKHVNDAELDMINKPERKDDYNLIITMPHMWKMFTGLGKNIGYCVWEGDRVPKSWIEEFENPKIDYIFVPSEHTKQAILKTLEPLEDGDINGMGSTIVKNRINSIIKVIPHGCDRSIFHSQQTKPTTLNLDSIGHQSNKIDRSMDKTADTFKFICNKGWRGTNWDRGGVQYVVKAFAEEFNKDEKVELIIKLNPAYINPQTIQQAMQQLNLPKEFALIHINCDLIPFDKLPDLYRQADCFVCATRAEAFNLPGMEAMSCGLPTIQTSFGGQTDYMTKENSYFVDYKLEEVKEDLMYEGIQWATPDINDLRKMLRQIFQDQDTVKKKGIFAEKDSKNWTWDITATKIMSILE